MGSKKSSDAKSALQIRWAVDKLITPALNAQYPKTAFKLNQRVGIETSTIMVARTGIRGSNDLVWVGNAANNAAKMAALKRGYTSYITATSYNRLHDWAETGGTPLRSMWTDLGSADPG